MACFLFQCRYTWFSASDECKAERHPLKVIDALKRFFKCNDCGNRTVSLSILPLLPCKKCSSTNWGKTAMMKVIPWSSEHQAACITFCSTIWMSGLILKQMSDLWQLGFELTVWNHFPFVFQERIVKSSHQLSIRGGEQKFVNSVVADANIDLLMPDE